MGNSAERIYRNRQTFYICGQCRDKQWHLIHEEPPVPCPDCGWMHKQLRKEDLPVEFKISLTQY